jgi:hypothetical protein
MTILNLKLFLTLILLRASLQDDKKFKCATYSCSNFNGCAAVTTFDPDSPNYVILSKCKNGETCQVPGNPWQTLAYSQKKEVFPCIKDTPFNKRFPGEVCNYDSDCAGRKKEGSCVDMKCIGAGMGESCKKHNECVAGLFCDKSGICAEQKGLGAECNNSYECINSLLCGGGTCSVTPYSLPEGAKVDGDFLKEKCALGFVHNGQCSSLKQTDSVDWHGFRRCELGEKCTYSATEEGSVVIKDCQCGYNEDGYGYCPRGHDASK